MEKIVVQCSSCQKKFKVASQGSTRNCPKCQGMLVLVPKSPQPIPVQQPTAVQHPSATQRPVPAQRPVAASSASAAPSFDFEGPAARSRATTTTRVRRRKSNWLVPAVLVLCVIGMMVAAVVVIKQGNNAPTFELAMLNDQVVREQERLALQVTMKNPQPESDPVRYSLIKGPADVQIDDRTGQLVWSPRTPGNYQISVQAVAGKAVSKRSFNVTVTKRAEFASIAKFDNRSGVQEAEEPAQPKNPSNAEFGGKYATSTMPPVEAVTSTTTEPVKKPVTTLDSRLSDPAATDPETIASAETNPELELLLPLYENKTLYKLNQYDPLRHFYADRFATQHQEQIKQGLAEDYGPLMQWLDEHKDIKEELYTAINPKFDSIPQVFSLFRDLWKKFPSKIGPYANLAIAIAVTWDNPRAIYDYANHQTRAKSNMPEELVDAIGNFQYMMDAEQYMQNRGQLLPWEFLVLLVDHKTPVMERGWAMQNYVSRRVMFGKCYGDVPYDHTMLNSGSAVARLNGQAYTLPNLKNFGGVCAHQADYAARVGKSIGVPGAYVRGESRYGELHAWIMWIELKSVTKQGIVFSLESHGRYRGDKYYVGRLTDPQTGQDITDRQLELRLNTIGVDVLAKRHSDRLMTAFPVLREAKELSVSDQLNYLRQVVNLCPGNERAWQAIADLSAAAANDPKLKKQVKENLDTLFTTFAHFPDFTWTIFDKMIAFETKVEERNSLYLRLIQLYFSAQRPDLACEASMKLADDLFEQGNVDTSIEVLATAIKFFPDEGRYVPRMLDRLEQVAANVESYEQKLVLFYTQFLPLIPQKRGDKASDYCVQMYQRGIAVFQKNNQPALAQGLQAQLNKLTGG